MTTLVRSVFARRNPRNVPLDLWAASEQEVPDYYHRLSKVAQDYKDIFSEIIRTIGEHAYRIRSQRLLQSGADAEQIKRLGEEIAIIVRETLAANLAYIMFGFSLYIPDHKSRTSFGKSRKFRKYSASEMRDKYEARADLLGQWIRALAAYQARPERIGFRALHPESYREHLAKAEAALSGVEKTVTAIQSTMAGNQGSLVTKEYDLRTHAGDLAYALGGKDLADAITRFQVTDVADLRRSVAKAERLARKGEPGVSRKLSLAEEKRIAALEASEPKQNPFIRSILGYT